MFSVTIFSTPSKYRIHFLNSTPSCLTILYVTCEDLYLASVWSKDPLLSLSEHFQTGSLCSVFTTPQQTTSSEQQ